MVVERPRVGSTKPKFLLDEGLPPRKRLKVCSQTWNIRHIAADYKLGGAPDSAVYALGVDEGRSVVTFNGRDFKKLLGPKSPSVIAVSHNVPPGKLDPLLQKTIRQMQPSDLCGKVIPVIAPNPSAKRRE